jgi:hypothetical protein
LEIYKVVVKKNACLTERFFNNRYRSQGRKNVNTIIVDLANLIGRICMAILNRNVNKLLEV